MIVRTDAKGTLILIRQTEHSRFVGQIAAHWGNARFAKPEPFDSVVRAAAFHDFGWLNYETSPMIDSASGVMPTFTSPPPGQAHYNAYQWCNEWMTGIDRYSGLLVNMHRTGLWRNRHGTITHPQGYNIKTMSPDAKEFVLRNEAVQERERASFDAKQLWVNYWLVQVWDLLGLYFCCKDPIEDHIEPVPITYHSSKSDGVQLKLRPLTPRKVAFDPYPFDVRPCHVQLIWSLLGRPSFTDVGSFRAAYFQAPVEIVNFELV